MKIEKHLLIMVIAVLMFGHTNAQNQIVHDAEYYIFEAQNGKKWAVEDGDLDKKLAELKKKYKNAS